MANNFQVNVYQIDQRLIDPSIVSIRYGFPTAGVIIQDVSTSPTRSLPSGYNVYGVILVPRGAGSANTAWIEFYVGETIAQLATLIS